MKQRKFLPDMQFGRAKTLEDFTLDGFGGGLNGVETDNGMNPKFLIALNNFRRIGHDGREKLRFGTNWFVDINTVVTGNIVNIVYFSNALIAVTSTGQVAAVTDVGVASVIWNSTIAALLPGAPTGWSSGLTSIDFVLFKNELIIHNGVDKPLTINVGLIVTYLADAATGSNTNVPIGKFGCVVSNYHCVAGVTALPTSIYISAIGTSGTFPGDPAPNDSISIDVGAYAPEGAPTIKGIAGYRSFLVVFFAGQSVLVQLGVYDSGGVHTPDFPDAPPTFGLFGHRCILHIEQDLLFAGNSGVASARKNLYAPGQLDNTPISSLIDPLIRRTTGLFTTTQMTLNSFMVFDKLSRDMMLFTPSGVGFVYSYSTELRYKSWSTFSGPVWTAGCVSSLNRLFLTIGSRIFQYGNNIFANEDYAADRMNDRDGNWAVATPFAVNYIARDTVTNESYKCIVAHVSGATTFLADRTSHVLSPKWELYEGLPIDFEMELPWLDSKNPHQIKFGKYVRVMSNGTATFTLRVWVDNLYKDTNGLVVYNPAISMDFVGNDAPGFGYDAGPYGGGRRSGDPRLMGFPIKFKKLKVGITGSTREPLEISSISFLYLKGLFKR
jgi:hypothetical protein